MEQVCVQLTVLFEEPFWIGLCERRDSSGYAAGKITFGAEPKDYEVWEFVLISYHQLKFSPPVAVTVKREATNPKRIQREARKQSAASIWTKSQQALQLLREENKLERKTVSREQREAEKQRQFELKQEKRKQKHRGR